MDDLVGICECRKCGKTYVHPHKCLPSKEVINDLKDLALGLAAMVNNKETECTTLRSLVRKIVPILSQYTGNYRRIDLSDRFVCLECGMDQDEGHSPLCSASIVREVLSSPKVKAIMEEKS
jgi:hypothetical protein